MLFKEYGHVHDFGGPVHPALPVLQYHGPPSPACGSERTRSGGKTARDLGLQYVVVTSVTRDDLPDGGAGHFAAVIQAIRLTGEDAGQTVRVEVLIPDFQGDVHALKTVMAAGPDVINHNIETVDDLYVQARPEAVYQRSLDLLRNVKLLNPDMPAKSGIMVGLGETRAQVKQTLRDLADHGCDMLTIGQYLQPTRNHLPVQKFYPPQEFEELAALARDMGFKKVASGPFVRSSYKAEELFQPPTTQPLTS